MGVDLKLIAADNYRKNCIIFDIERNSSMWNLLRDLPSIPALLNGFDFYEYKSKKTGQGKRSKYVRILKKLDPELLTSKYIEGEDAYGEPLRAIAWDDLKRVVPEYEDLGLIMKRIEDKREEIFSETKNILFLLYWC